MKTKYATGMGGDIELPLSVEWAPLKNGSGNK